MRFPQNATKRFVFGKGQNIDSQKLGLFASLRKSPKHPKLIERKLMK